MSIFGVRTRAADGSVVFDSTTDRTLLFVEERVISGSGFSPLTLSYPSLAGMKINPFLISPYQNGEIDLHQILSCRVTYPSGVPTVSIFSDNTQSDAPICDALLTVFATGASQ